MKRIVSVMVVVGMMTVGARAFGWGIPSLPTVGSGDGGATVDVNALTAREGILKVRVNKATVTLAHGLVEIQKACGMATEAAKLEATLVEAQKNPSDMEGTKKLCAQVNDASGAMKNVDLNASMNKGEARKRLGKSLLHLGVGTLVDAQATGDAMILVSDITNSVQAVQAAPMTYGLSAVRNLASGLSTAKFGAETIPTQLLSIGELTKGLIKYAQTNKIEIPSKKEQDKQAAAMNDKE